MAEKASSRKFGGRGRQTGRTEFFAAKVTPEFKERVQRLHQRDGILIAELLEQALDAYEARSKRQK